MTTTVTRRIDLLDDVEVDDLIGLIWDDEGETYLFSTPETLTDMDMDDDRYPYANYDDPFNLYPDELRVSSSVYGDEQRLQGFREVEQGPWGRHWDDQETP